MQFKEKWKHHTKSKLTRYLSSNTWVHKYSERQRKMPTQVERPGYDKEKPLLLAPRSFQEKLYWKNKVEKNPSLWESCKSKNKWKSLSWNNENLIVEDVGQCNFPGHRSLVIFSDLTSPNPIIPGSPSIQGQESLLSGVPGS